MLGVGDDVLGKLHSLSLPKPPALVILNLFQDPSRRRSSAFIGQCFHWITGIWFQPALPPSQRLIEKSGLTAKWILKQVQGDGG